MQTGVWKFLSEEAESQIYNAILTIVESNSIELVELRFNEEYGKATLTVFLWKEDGITLDDCEKIHNLVSDELDNLDKLFPSDYVLNVSSSGLDRPIVLDDDFRRALGTEIEIKEGKKRTHGYLVSYDDSVFTIETEGKKPQQITFQRSNKTKVQPHIRF